MNDIALFVSGGMVMINDVWKMLVHHPVAEKGIGIIGAYRSIFVVVRLAQPCSVRRISRCLF